jgi:hypothetical protein
MKIIVDTVVNRAYYVIKTVRIDQLNQGEPAMKVSEYREFAEKTVTSYRTDLQYDIDYMNTGKPCMLFLRQMGSHMITFEPFEEYPKSGEKVEYLFGYTDRYHLLKDKTIMVECCLNSTETREVLYFNGKEVKVINHGRARNIIAKYHARINASF